MDKLTMEQIEEANQCLDIEGLFVHDPDFTEESDSELEVMGSDFMGMAYLGLQEAAEQLLFLSGAARNEIIRHLQAKYPTLESFLTYILEKHRARIYGTEASVKET